MPCMMSRDEIREEVSTPMESLAKPKHIVRVAAWNVRKRGRPLGTWRRTIEEEMKAAGKTWNEVSWLAQDRDGWKKFVSALCSTRSEED